MDKYTKILSLKSVLDEYSVIVIKDEINPNNYIVNYKSLIEKFPFNPLINYCDNKNITVDNLISFLDENDSNKTSNKIGKVALIFPMLYGMYNISYLMKEHYFGDYIYEIFHGYNWSNLVSNMDLLEKIKPKRIAFMVCDLVKQNINKYYSNLLVVDF